MKMVLPASVTRVFFLALAILTISACSRVEVFSSDTSLAGVDSNSNGVRDDVDQLIAKNGFNKEQMRGATQFAATMQKAVLVNPSDEVAVQEVAFESALAINCLYRVFPNDKPHPSLVVHQIESATTNTKPRLVAYLSYNQALDGTVSTDPLGDSCQ